MSTKYKILNQDCLYFITFAPVGFIDLFVRKEYRDIIVESLKFCQKNKGLEIYSWCIMTNHLHLIVGRNGENKIEEIIRDFKKFTSVSILREIEQSEVDKRKDWMLEHFAQAAAESKKHVKYKFWQDQYHPIELFSNDMMDQKLEYIHQNPVKAGMVYEAEKYLYSSARDYAGTKGLIDVKFIE